MRKFLWDKQRNDVCQTATYTQVYKRTKGGHNFISHFYDIILASVKTDLTGNMINADMFNRDV